VVVVVAGRGEVGVGGLAVESLHRLAFDDVHEFLVGAVVVFDAVHFLEGLVELGVHEAVAGGVELVVVRVAGRLIGLLFADRLQVGDVELGGAQAAVVLRLEEVVLH